MSNCVDLCQEFGMPSERAIQVSAGDLGDEHRTVLRRSISQVLATNRGTETLAQIIDGLPTQNTFDEYRSMMRDEPTGHLEICSEALRLWKSFRARFNADVLLFDAKLAQAFQSTSPGSKQFALRLLEMTAIACHDIAASLFTSFDGGLHTRDLLPEPLSDGKPIFYHPAYRNWDQYPHGAADVVGYWAELRLFGGVVVFDRGSSDIECKDAFIHPIRDYKTYLLSDGQVQQFAELALNTVSPFSLNEAYTLPFPTERYTRRVDPYDAMDSLHIYRNRYERKFPATRPRRCVTRMEDEPELQDALDKLRASGAI